MNEKDVDTFEMLNAQLKGLHTEIQTLAKKSANDSVNLFKLRLINAVLEKTNAFLNDAQKPIEYFSRFDENDMPSNSDVLIVLSQYLNCLEKIRADNVVLGDYEGKEWYWVIDGTQSSVRTSPPKKLSN